MLRVHFLCLEKSQAAALCLVSFIGNRKTKFISFSEWSGPISGKKPYINPSLVKGNGSKAVFLNPGKIT